MALRIHTNTKRKDDDELVKYTMQEYQITKVDERCRKSLSIYGFTDKDTYMVVKYLYSFTLYN